MLGFSFEVFSIGNFFAFLGAALAVGLAGAGSAKGVGVVGEAASGVLSEDPDKFGQMIVLQAIPGTQGIYGLLVALLIMLQTGMFGGAMNLTLEQGAYVFASALPTAITGLISGYAQGRTAAAGVNLVAKRPDQLAKAIINAALVETYAIFGLLISLLMLFNISL